jgi:hypothetical protein
VTARAGSAPRTDSSARAGGWLRAGLTVLALITLIAGAWQYFAPRSFYTDVPTVAADPPFNQHLMTDVGGLGLALALVLGAAAVTMDRLLIRVALAAYLVYSISHLLFHVTHLAGLSAGGIAFLVIGLTLLPLLALALLILATRATRRISG